MQVNACECREWNAHTGNCVSCCYNYDGFSRTWTNSFKCSSIFVDAIPCLSHQTHTETNYEEGCLTVVRNASHGKASDVDNMRRRMCLSPRRQDSATESACRGHTWRTWASSHCLLPLHISMLTALQACYDERQQQITETVSYLLRSTMDMEIHMHVYTSSCNMFHMRITLAGWNWIDNIHM